MHPFLFIIHLQAIFIFSFVGYENLTYQGYTYPWWGYVIGWLLALSSMLTVLLYFLYALMAADGDIRDVSISCYINMFTRKLDAQKVLRLLRFAVLL